MSQVNCTANHCDVCGHEWIPKPDVVYTHCTSGKCRSRKWNMSSVPGAESGKVDIGPKSSVAIRDHYQGSNVTVKDEGLGGSNPSTGLHNRQALRDICAGKITSTSSTPSDVEKAEISICGKTWWEDGEQYECLMDKGHREAQAGKHGLRGMVRRLDA